MHGCWKDFFQGETLGGFSKFFPGEAKSGEISFFPLESKKTIIFCLDFKNLEGTWPTIALSPADDHEYMLWQPCININSLSLVYKYSGFNFSYYDLPFPTRYCIPYV